MALKGVCSLFIFVWAAFGVAHGRVTQKEIDDLGKKFVEIVRPYQEEMAAWGKQLVYDLPSARADWLTCDVCHPAILVARPLLENGGTDEELTLAIAKVCELFVGYPPDVCYGTISGYVVPIAYILRNNPTLTNDDFCNILNENCGTVNSAFTNWETEVADGKPEPEERPKLPENVKRTKILHLTDIHLDLGYTVGMATECALPLCCRVDSGLPAEGVAPAGPYGHFGCGLPYNAMAEFYRHASEQHPDAKYIFLTGDYIHHGAWLYGEDHPNGTIGENRRHHENVTNTLREFFPSTTVIPLTGNHETPISNLYPPPANQDVFPLRWMYTSVSSPFEDYMGGPGQVGSFKHGGFYTVSPEPGLRFVVLNTNLCYLNNFWLPHDPIDPIGQLKWFSKTMAKAEAAGENVIILAHIPPGYGDCWSHWSNQYARVVDRYSHIIRFQVHGHTHNEFYTVSFDKDSSSEKPNSVSFMGPSAVPDFGDIGYKVYYVDGERKEESTWELIDHETWMMNLNQSNIHNSPVWYRSYSASQDLGLTAHRPQDYYDLTLRMIDDKELFEKFRTQVFQKGNTADYVYAPCTDPGCTIRVICYTVYHNPVDRGVCTKLIPMIEKNFYSSVATSLPSSVVSTLTTLLVIFWANHSCRSYSNYCPFNY